MNMAGGKSGSTFEGGGCGNGGKGLAAAAVDGRVCTDCVVVGADGAAGLAEGGCGNGDGGEAVAFPSTPDGPELLVAGGFDGAALD